MSNHHQSCKKGFWRLALAAVLLYALVPANTQAQTASGTTTLDIIPTDEHGGPNVEDPLLHVRTRSSKRFELLTPDETVIDAFVHELASKGHRVTVRRPRGPDIQAACGQLALRRSGTAA